MKTRYKEMLRGLLPAIIFMVVYKIISFNWAVIISFGVGIAIYVTQYYKDKKLTSFSYIGIFGLVVQTVISLLARNPNTYFVYPLIANCIWAIIFGLSLLFEKDAVSFLVKDLCETNEEYLFIKPALRRLTLLWTVFLGIKAFIKFIGIMNWSFEVLFVVNWILGYPGEILLLWYSYQYPKKYAKRMLSKKEISTL